VIEVDNNFLRVFYILWGKWNNPLNESKIMVLSKNNELVERKNRTLVDMVNAMLLNAKLPNNLWGEALLAACHIHNRVLSKKLNVSSYEAWNGSD